MAGGAYLGMREWTLGILQLLGQLHDDWWLTPDAAVTTLLLRAGSIAIGSGLAGAGRVHGSGVGFVVGLLATVGFLFSDVALRIPVGPLAVVFALVLLAVGGIAGTIGAMIWPGPTEQPVTKHQTASRGSSLLQLVEETAAEQAQKPTQWVRVLLSGVLATLAISQAESVRLGLRAVAGQSLNLGNSATFIYVDLQIAVILLAIATMISGTTTGAGLRHGLYAGLIAAFGIVVMSSRGMLPPAVEGWLQLWHLPITLANGKSLAAVAGGVLLFSTMCGGLGNSLLPPLARGEQRSRRMLD